MGPARPEGARVAVPLEHVVPCAVMDVQPGSQAMQVKLWGTATGGNGAGGLSRAASYPAVHQYHQHNHHRPVWSARVRPPPLAPGRAMCFYLLPPSHLSWPLQRQLKARGLNVEVKPAK